MQGVNASYRILYHPDFNRRLRNFTASVTQKVIRGLYHRWGISPRPENKY